MTRKTPEAASARAAVPGADDEGLLRLRRAIGDRVMARMKDEIPGLSAHFGEDCEKSDDPEARIYRSSGASFRWLAFAFSPWRMWDLHVGVVVADERHLSIGFHASERAGEVLLPDLERLGRSVGAPVRHQKEAIEYQANLPLYDVDAVPLETLVGTIERLCREYAPVAAKVRCPAGMGDGAA